MPATAFLGERPTGQLAGLACTPHATEAVEARSVADGSHLGTLPLGTPEDLAEAARRAADAQRAWAAMPAWFRLAGFRRLAELLDTYRTAAAEVVRAETGGPLQAADDLVRHAGPQCRKLATATVRRLRPVRHRAGLRVRSVEVRTPHGVVGVVPDPAAPFDPVTATAALVTGNGLVIVPLPDSGFTSLLLAQLFAAARLPAGLVQVVPGRADLAAALPGVVDHVVLGGAVPDEPGLRAACAERGTGLTIGRPSDPLEFTASTTLARR